MVLVLVLVVVVMVVMVMMAMSGWIGQKVLLNASSIETAAEPAVAPNQTLNVFFQRGAERAETARKDSLLFLFCTIGLLPPSPTTGPV
jgi:flagellar basal body-associated protein FliL